MQIVVRAVLATSALAAFVGFAGTATFIAAIALAAI